MPEKPKPYIGVTGITTPSEAQAAAEEFKRSMQEHKRHVGMTGFLVSSRSLEDPSYSNERYPSLHSLPGLLKISKESGALNTIHYKTRDKSTLANQVIEIFERDGIYDNDLCRALQLNVAWPPKEEVAKIKERFPEMRVILQIGSSILNTEYRFDVADEIGNYGALVDYVLIDPSGGKGRESSADFYSLVYRPINQKVPDQTIIFAGGLHDENVFLRLNELGDVLNTTEFGIDAEQGLRVIDPQTGAETLSREKLRKYIDDAAKFFVKATEG